MPKISLRRIASAAAEERALTWLTCYDFSMACALNETDLDMILVGDSGGMVVLGFEDTVPVTMEQMLTLTAAVRRGAPDKFLVGDMPKGSYEISHGDAVQNAMRFVKETGCDAVKLEGGARMSETIAAIVGAGIPVIGHVGLTPQSSGALGGYRVIGRDEKEAGGLVDDALALEQAGASLVLIEAVPPSVGAKVTEALSVPTFGIGAGPHVNGQLMILHDLLGLYPMFRPKFAKCFIPDVIEGFNFTLASENNGDPSELVPPRDGFFELTRLATQRFVEDVRAGNFPGVQQWYQE